MEIDTAKPNNKLVTTVILLVVDPRMAFSLDSLIVSNDYEMPRQSPRSGSDHRPRHLLSGKTPVELDETSKVFPKESRGCSLAILLNLSRDVNSPTTVVFFRQGQR
jgi:hypothetical protein